MTSERLQKVLSQAGFGSRRSCEEIIEHQRVTVNGITATLGTKADIETDLVKVDGKPLTIERRKKTFILFHKTAGVRTDTDPADPRPSVRDLIPVEGHLYPVGRLDIDAEGLVLMTDDGDLANRLTHPRYGHEKEYQVLVVGKPDEKQLAAWRRGVVLVDGGKTLPAKVYVQRQKESTTWLKIIMREGRKRQIKEVGKTLGLPVKRIIRTRLATLELGNLKPGSWRNLSEDEIEKLRSSVQKESSAGKKKVTSNQKQSSKTQRKWVEGKN
jgi:23S rRNA pseudouridine2605 synthase